MEKLCQWVAAVKRLSISERLIFLTFLLIPFLPFLSSPALPRLGVWYQSEPLVIGVFGLAALCALGLVVALLIEPKAKQAEVMGSIYHPVVVLPVLIFIWSVVMMPFVQTPLLSLYGAPQTGLGGAWFLAVAVLTGGFRYLFYATSCKVLKESLAIYLVLAAVAMTLIGTGQVGGWRPFYYGDYLAFIGIFTWLAVSGIASGRAVLQSVAILVGAGVILISENRAAYGALATMPLVYVAAIWIRNNFTNRKRLLLASIPAFFLLAISVVVGFLRYSFIWTALPEYTRNTILSRSLMLDVIKESLVENPIRLITGEGWGMFSQTLINQLPNTKTSFVQYARDTDNPLWQWDAVWRLDFDSHNFLAESVLSGGLVAGLLVLIWLGSAVAYSKAKLLPVSVAGISAFALTAGFWFQMPLSVPFMALALAAISARAAGRIPGLPKNKGQAKVALVLSFLVLAAATADSLRFAVHTSRAVDANFTTPDPNSSSNPEIFANDTNRGHLHFNEIMSRYIDQVVTALKTNKAIAPWRSERLEQFMDEADRRVESNAPIQVAILALNTRSDLAFLDRHIELGLPFGARLKSWSNILDLVLARFPKRDDLALAYHLWLLKQGKEAELLMRSEKLLARNDQSLVGLWFSGVVLIGDPSRGGQGMARLRLAIENGIERIMPVDAVLKKSIMEFQSG